VEALGVPDDERLKMAGGLHGWLYRTHLRTLLLVYLTHVDDRSEYFDLGAYSQGYEWLEQFVFAPETIDAVSLIEVRNLELEPGLDTVPLGPGITLRRATDDERIRSLGELSPFALQRYMGGWIPPLAFLEVRAPSALPVSWGAAKLTGSNGSMT